MSPGSARQKYLKKTYDERWINQIALVDWAMVVWGGASFFLFIELFHNTYVFKNNQ